MATQTSNPVSDMRPKDSVPAIAPAVSVGEGPEVRSSPSNPHRLRQLYELLLKCNMIQERVSQLSRNRVIDPYAAASFSSLATGVGSLIELRRGDAVAAYDPIVTGVLLNLPLEYTFCLLHGRAAEYCTAHPDAFDGTVHRIPATTTAAAQFQVAAGMALSNILQGRRDVVMVHALDGFAALGFWHEAAVLACQERLPLIFVLETDAISASRYNDSILRDRAEAYGMPGITVAGDDVVAVWRVAQESIHRARSGAGPTLIDCRVSAAAKANQRKAAGRSTDALSHMQHYLEKRSHWDQKWKNDITQKFAAEIDQAAQVAERIGPTQ